LREGAPFELVSRETGLVINNLLLCVILGIVFIGTLYPIFSEAMGARLSIGGPYFNVIVGPLALVLMVLVGIGPLLAWRREQRPVFRQLTIPALLGVAALAITLIIAPEIAILPRLGFAVAAYLAAASLLPLVTRNPLRAPLATWGMVIAHFGIAVSLAGMAANAAFTSERLAVALPGQTLNVGPWLVQLEDVTPTAGKNWTALEAQLRASRGSGPVFLNPQTRYFSNPPTETNEAAIQTFWDGQLYTVVGKRDPGGGWQLRLWWKPFVTLIWAGGALIALGGALALLGRLMRLRRRERRAAADWRKERYA
jgi:cytochrome c-type biogenesis protein CcmF